MVFACQKDSFLKEFTTSVVSCSPATIEKLVDGKKASVDGFKVILEDTILFPEGGGQPCDHGFLDDVPVLQVTRVGGDAVHFVGSPIDVGKTVKQSVDWDRRLDHMQHHSGQHLITGIILSLYGYETTSWWLGEDICHIELDTSSLKQSEIDNIEKISNEKIRDAVNVFVKVYSRDDPILNEVRGRGLPEDMVGEVRVVTIDGLDTDMCCGTHVTNTSQLQVIKLLNAEKGKKGKVNLQFLVGGRVIRKMAQLLAKEQQLTAILNNGPEHHVELVSKAHKNAKTLNKNLQTLLKEMAISEAKALKKMDPKPKYFNLHRKEADADFMNIFVKEYNQTDVVLFLSVGDEKGAGQVLLYGEESLIKSLGDQISEILDGKGAAKGPRFTAKVKNLKNRSKAEKLIEQQVGQL